ncbi:MAG TPA: amphi-Trp domain-containing protein [Methanothrix soehngenii]|nr:amphi-Trp domain-containing protein [Methanothrix soehngenii]
MAKIKGRPGKTAGSPAGGVKFEQEIYMTAAEMADMLRGLADEVEARGRVEASFGDWTIGVNASEPLKAEIQYKHDPSRRELEVQLKLKENP